MAVLWSASSLSERRAGLSFVAQTLREMPLAGKGGVLICFTENDKTCRGHGHSSSVSCPLTYYL